MQKTQPFSSAVRTTAFSVCALLAATVLTACGAGDGGDAKAGKDGVSTLETGSPASDGKPGTSASSKTDSRRPQLRLDSSEEEIDKLDNAYNACLQSHGVPMNTKRAEMAGAKQAAPMQSMEIAKKYKPAYDACLVKLPRRPPEQDPAINPHYTDDYRTYVKCLTDKGMRIHMLQDEHGIATGWTYNDSKPSALSEAEQDKADKVCTKEAFSGK
ncbi:hypothetical protein [Streptomyces sp. NPDC048644]|uniref:hypothetical protein n=1 Tax=Streptomyces sp. NPDC048644 TaxID=3365582 RepID=UPI0037241966